MYSLELVSLLIAVVATAGAIPLCRSVFRWWVLREGGALPRVAAVPVAGIAMVFGVLISVFYVDASLAHITEFVAAVAVLIVANFWMERQGVGRGRNFWFELGGSAVVGLALTLPLFRLDMKWSIIDVVLLAVAVVTPMAVSLLSRSPRATPALPTAIVLVQILMIALLGAMGAGDAMATSRYHEFLTIALPLIGAAIGALIYLCRMPWRAEAAVSTGVAARLCLGLAVGWGAVKLGIGRDEAGQTSAALIWILVVPIYESLGRHVVIGLRNVLLDFGFSARRRSMPGLEHSPATICMSVLIFGGIGICMWRLQIPAVWSFTWLAPALVGYLITPKLLLAWSRYLHSRVTDARSQ